jgi:hypothetical protein
LLAAAAVFANRRREAGWPWLVSRIAFVLAALISAMLLITLLLDRPRN